MANQNYCIKWYHDIGPYIKCVLPIQSTSSIPMCADIEHIHNIRVTRDIWHEALAKLTNVVSCEIFIPDKHATSNTLQVKKHAKSRSNYWCKHSDLGQKYWLYHLWMKTMHTILIPHSEISWCIFTLVWCWCLMLYMILKLEYHIFSYSL